MEHNESKDKDREAYNHETGYPNIDLKEGHCSKLELMLLNVENQVLDSKGHCRQHLNQLEPQVVVEASLVSLTNAVANPWAVMVMSSHTLITQFAVLCAKRLLKVADCTVLILNEEDDLIITIWRLLLFIIEIGHIVIRFLCRDLLLSQSTGDFLLTL